MNGDREAVEAGVADAASRERADAAGTDHEHVVSHAMVRVVRAKARLMVAVAGHESMAAERLTRAEVEASQGAWESVCQELDSAHGAWRIAWGNLESALVDAGVL